MLFPMVFAFLLIPVMSMTRDLFLFRRKKQVAASREEAFLNLFAALAAIYESAAGLKPIWIEQWRARSLRELPEKYAIDDEIVTGAAHDMRFAVALLQRNRWKSVVQPLFDTVDRTAWQQFQDAAATISAALIDLNELHADLLMADEQDWITTAIEEFDDATRRRRMAERDDVPLYRRVAEGTYQPVYIAIQLSDRLIERRRNELLEAR